jgi:predicted alpha/beta-fold hydrolase
MDFDDEFTRKTFKFESVHEYYYQASCYHFLPSIVRPTLCLNALDDPIVPDKVIPYSQLAANPHIILATTKSGGHLGWYQNRFFPRRWFAPPVAEFLAALARADLSMAQENRRNSKEQSESRSRETLPVKSSSFTSPSKPPVANQSVQTTQPSAQREDRSSTLQYLISLLGGPAQGAQQQQMMLHPSRQATGKLASVLLLFSLLLGYWARRR